MKDETYSGLTQKAMTDLIDIQVNDEQGIIAMYYSENDDYCIAYQDKLWKCTCEDFRFRQDMGAIRICKHILATIKKLEEEKA